MEDGPTAFDLLGDFFMGAVDPAPLPPMDDDDLILDYDDGNDGDVPVLVGDDPPVVIDEPVPAAPPPLAEPRTLAEGEIFTTRFEDYSSNNEHLARLDGQPFREFLSSIDSPASETEPDDLSPDEIFNLASLNAQGDTSLGLLDGGGYAGDLLIIQSNYTQALSLLETTTFFFLSIVMVMIVILMGIFVVIGLDWPVAVSIILVALLFLYFASGAYRSVVAHSLGVARSEQIRAIVRVRRLARLNLDRTPTLLAWAQHLGSKP